MWLLLAGYGRGTLLRRSAAGYVSARRSSELRTGRTWARPESLREQDLWLKRRGGERDEREDERSGRRPAARAEQRPQIGSRVGPVKRTHQPDARLDGVQHRHPAESSLSATRATRRHHQAPYGGGGMQAAQMHESARRWRAELLLLLRAHTVRGAGGLVLRGGERGRARCRRIRGEWCYASVRGRIARSVRQPTRSTREQHAVCRVHRAGAWPHPCLSGRRARSGDEDLAWPARPPAPSPPRGARRTRRADDGHDRACATEWSCHAEDDRSEWQLAHYVNFSYLPNCRILARRRVCHCATQHHGPRHHSPSPTPFEPL